MKDMRSLVAAVLVFAGFVALGVGLPGARGSVNPSLLATYVDEETEGGALETRPFF